MTALWTGLGALVWHLHPAAVAVPAFGLLATAAFFRDPRRRAPEGEENLVAPADGRITDVTPVDHEPLLNGPAIKIGIFLSILDVHVNRAPCTARVQGLAYTPGKFHDARSPLCGSENEAMRIHMVRPDGRPLVVRQVAGRIARRIVCAVKEGETVDRGSRIGMIKFGSRTELWLRASDAEVLVQPGMRARGGETILARLKT